MSLKKNFTVLSVVAFIGMGTFLVQQCKPKEAVVPLSAGVNAFVGNQQCKSCHASEYKAWSGSGHFKAMQEANDSTVEGDFSGKILVADGVTSRFLKKTGNIM